MYLAQFGGGFPSFSASILCTAFRGSSNLMDPCKSLENVGYINTLSVTISPNARFRYSSSPLAFHLFMFSCLTCSGMNGLSNIVALMTIVEGLAMLFSSSARSVRLISASFFAWGRADHRSLPSLIESLAIISSYHSGFSRSSSMWTRSAWNPCAGSPLEPIAYIIQPLISSQISNTC